MLKRIFSHLPSYIGLERPSLPSKERASGASALLQKAESDTRPSAKGRMPVALALAAAVALVIAPGCTGSGKGSGPAASVPFPVTVAAAKSGPISRTISFSGTIVPVEQVELIPGVAGRVEEVKVAVGDRVPKGTVLVELEKSSLEAQVKQAEGNLRGAQAKLDQLLEGARSEDVAAAKALLEVQRAKLSGMREGGRQEQVAAAEASLSAARAKLEDIKAGPKSVDIQTAQAAVDAAQAALDNAKSGQFRLLNASAEDLESAEAAVEAAKAGVESARAALADLKARPKPADLQAAQAVVVAAQAAYDKSRAQMDTLRNRLNEEKVKNIINARLRLRAAREKLKEDEAKGAPPEQLDKDNEEIILSYRAVQDAEKDLDWPKLGISVEDIVVAQANIDSALANLTSAQQNLDTLKAGPTEAQLTAAANTHQQAKAALTVTRTKLSTLKSPSPADRQAAQSAVSQAKANLDAAQARLQRVLEGATESELQAAQAAVVQVDTQLALTKSPFTSNDLKAQEEVVAQAESQFSKAGSPYTSSDVKSATAAVAVAEAALDLARIQLDNASVKAPFDAVIAKKLVSPGAMASVQSSVLSLVSQMTKLEFQAEEATAASIQIGQKGAITLPSLPGESFTAVIASISPTADAATRSFSVTALPLDQGGRLRGGMFATVEVVLEEKVAGVTVPTQALVKRDGKDWVFVVVDNTVEMREVRTGVTTSTRVEVQKGLDSGDKVVVQGNKTLKDGDKVKATEK